MAAPLIGILYTGPAFLNDLKHTIVFSGISSTSITLFLTALLASMGAYWLKKRLPPRNHDILLNSLEDPSIFALTLINHVYELIWWCPLNVFFAAFAVLAADLFYDTYPADQAMVSGILLIGGVIGCVKVFVTLFVIFEDRKQFLARMQDL